MRSKIVAVMAVLAAAAAGARPQAPAKAYFQLHEAAPGVYAAIGIAGSGAGSNAGFVIGTRAVAVVDTFQSVAAARALLAAIRERTALPVRYVINTHYHIDHVTGNQVFADAGAVVMAQRNVSAWIHTENLKFYGPHPTAAAQASVEALRAPDVSYADGVWIDLGGKQLEVRVLPGHTGGDSAVRVEGSGVVFTGDLFWDHSLPNLVDASIAQLLTTLPKLSAWPTRANAVFVPGHGELGTAADVAAFRGYLIELQRLVAEARSRGLRGAALAAAVEPELKKQYGSWGFYAHFAPRNIADAEAEAAGTKRRPRPVE